MESLDANYIIIGGATVIILSYLFNLVAKRTSIPSVLMLIFIGAATMLVTSQFNINFLKDKSFNTLLSVLGTVGLILIVLEASLDLKLERKKLRPILLSLLIAFLGVLITTSALSLIFVLTIDTNWDVAIFHAIPLAIISSAIVIPSISNLIQKKKEFLIYESAFSDILGIMMFYFFKDNLGKDSALKVVTNIGGNVGLTIILSVIAGYILIIVLQKLTTHVKFFLLIAVLFMVYSTGKLMHLSPLLVIMFFGIILNNHEMFFRGFLKKWLNEEAFGPILRELKVMTAETAFLVRTFFFFIFGLSIKLDSLLNIDAIMLSLLILGAIYLTRIGLFTAFIGGKESSPQRMVAPRGLISILLFFQIPAQYKTIESYSGILLLIILTSSIIMTIALIRNKKKQSTLNAEQNSTNPSDDSTITPEQTEHSAQLSSSSDVNSDLDKSTTMEEESSNDVSAPSQLEEEKDSSSPLPHSKLDINHTLSNIKKEDGPDSTKG